MEYKELKGSRYLVREDGRIYCTKGKYLMQQYLNKTTSYYQVSLRIDNKTKTVAVHKIVAIAWLNHKPDGYKLVIDHIDENKKNNHYTNLREVTNSENVLRSQWKRLGYTSKIAYEKNRGRIYRER